MRPLGPDVPELAITALRYGAWEEMVAAAAARESFRVTSQTMGIREPFFCICWGGGGSRGGRKVRLLPQLSREMLRVGRG